MSGTADRLAHLSPEKRLLPRKRHQHRARGAGPPPVRPRPAGGGPLPLSFAQRRIWLAEQVAPGSVAYNLPLSLRLRGRLDARALGLALGELVRRHEALRTVFRGGGDGEPVQTVLPPAPVPLPVADLAGLAADDRERALDGVVAGASARPFDLERGPVLRAMRVRLAADDQALLFNMHHIVSDEWSMGIMVREMGELYDAFAAGRAARLPEPEVQYPDFALWQREHLGGAGLEAQLAFWRERLAGAPPLLDLPTDRPRAASASPRGGQRTRFFAAETGHAVRGLARDEGATLFMALLAAWQLVLARHAGTEDVPVGTPVAGRTRPEVEGTLGFFVNTLVMRADLSGDPTVREFLARVREGVLAAHANQDLPFDQLVDELQPERVPGQTPFFQVMFSLERATEEEVRLGGVDVDMIQGPADAVKFDLTMTAGDRAGRLAATLAFRRSLFDDPGVERMLAQYERVLAAMAADPGRRLSEIGLLSPEERARLLAAGRGPDADADPRPVHERFAAQAARTPHAAAVVFEGAALTYAELDRGSAALAGRLRALGVGPDVPAGILLERGPELAAAVLGVLRAGGAYLPLDPAHPDERLHLLLRDAGAAAVVAGPGLAERVEGCGVPVVAPLPPVAGPPPADGGAVPVDPDNLACVIYTSGSTGAPKGVLVTHRGLSNYLAWFDREVLGEEGFALPLVSRLGFDAHVRQLFPPLLRGGAVWILPESAATDPGALLEALAGREGVSFGGVPSLWSAVLERVRSGEGPRPAGLRAVLLGGEALPPELAERTFAEFPGVALRNHYGPTEATVNATAARVEPGRAFGIGEPIANVRVYLLDAYGNPVPEGVPGELHVAGAGVARGYLGRPDLTAEHFVPDPFAAEAGARMYRSGDRVRRRADGELDWLGRTDRQLKVRGFRIEPGEVEAALAAHPRVREAAVVARPDGAGDARLVGYVAPEGGAAPSAAELRAWLAGRLPGHLVPPVVVALDALPRTPSGKVDRRALPAPGGPAADAGAAPRTPTAEILAGIWAELLGVERVGAADDFFALGGHSLLATRAITRVRQATGADLPLRAMFEAPTPASLAERVDALLRAGAGLVPPPIGRAPRDGPLPLSYGQQRLWFIQRMEPESAAYNLPFPLRLRGALDPRTLRRALGGVARRHETLRTVFRDAGGAPELAVLPPAPFSLPVVDLTGLAGEDREREVRRVAAAEVLRPFDLERGPLLRVRMLRAGDAEWLLLGTIHHLVFDGWSTGVLTREVSALYEAFARGEPSPLPPLPLQYADFAAWQRGWLRGETLDRQVDFWRERLRGAPPLLDLPLDRPRPAVPDLAGGDFRFALPPAEVDALRGLARREGATAFVVLLAALQALLARCGAGDDVPVGTSAAGRTRLELEPLIGFFVNTLVLRGDLSGAPTGRELLRRVRETLLEAHAHQDLPFERVVAGLRPERSLSHNPLFQVFLAMVNVDSGELRLGGAEMSGVRTGAHVAQFELALAVSDQRGHMLPAFSYRRELFDESTVERLSARLRRLVAGMAADPGLRVGEIDLLAPAERRAVLAASRGADAGPPPERTLHALFADAAGRAPDAPAVEREGGGALTYAELHAASDRLARLLASRGAGPEAAVGVCMEWSPELVVAALGVLKAGAVYLPLDPQGPAERLASVLGDAGARLLLADASVDGGLPEGPWEVVRPDAERGGAGAAAADDPAPAAALPGSAAYLIYTSGSTGRPRGVVVEHRAAAAHSLAFCGLAGLGPGDRVLQFASAGFDVSLEQLFPTLLAGATLVLRGPEPWTPESFWARARALGISVANLPTAYWQAAAEDGAGAEDLPALRVVVVGGEAVPSAAVRRWRERLRTPHRLLNGYGPTEAVVTATVHELPAGFPGAYPWAVAPIGGPLPGRAAYVLDDAGGPAADGAPGELHLGGPLARGYLGRPEWTAERWIPDPFSGEAGARLYRTGDRVRRGPDGALEFLGRTDRQVKVRGFRIEPGEVEAALLRHPAVREAAVAVAGEGGGARLVAYLVPAGGREAPGAAELRELLRGALPEHMVPAAFTTLEALPLTPGGKLDRRALPAPGAGAGAGESRAPRTPEEERLAAIFAEVLGLERVGALDHFFDLGGHSLLAMRVVARVHREMGVEVPVRVLFEAPTPAELAAWLEANRPAPALEEWEVEEEWERLAGLPDEEVRRRLGDG